MKTGKALTEEIAQPAEDGELSFWWLGQLGYAVRMAGMRLYFDAFLSEHPGRLHTPVCAPQDIAGADLFFGSHDHDDHIDRPSWPLLAEASPKAKFVVPKLLASRLSEELGVARERFVGVSDGETVTIGNVRVTGVAAAHELLDRDEATGEYPYLGYVVRGGGRAVYHSGDTCLYEGMLAKLRALGPFDAAMLPINGRDAKRLRSGCIGNMTYQEAADLFGALRPGLCVPGHYEMFSNNTADPFAFCDYLDAKYPGLPVWIGPYGERVCVK